MKLSYQDVSAFLKTHEFNFKSLLEKIKLKIDSAKEGKDVPIYLTKFRIKATDSVYTKTKRFGIVDLMKEIKDYIGFRILCLFEQDIFELHNFIIDNLCADFTLDEVKIYNWDDERYQRMVLSLKENVKNHCGIDAKEGKKDSGYKSIHYILKQPMGDNEYYIEIQLRTLLQDVWGELEHSLSYKRGNIHPHIKKSFQLLAMDIEKNDSLMSHLKTISDRERVGHLYSMEEGGPVNYFGYEPEKIPDDFNNEPLKTLFDSYNNFMLNTDLSINKNISIDKAKDFLKELCDKLTYSMTTKKEIDYFIKMEKAFLFYWQGGKDNLEKALKIYRAIIDENSEDHFILHFRMGEIFFIKEDITEALKCFDDCEEMLTKGCCIEPLNLYKAKLKLAYYYWLMGQDYMELCINMIDDAEKIFKANEKSFSEKEHNKLINNLCSYYLERYLINKANRKQDVEKDFQLALDRLVELEQVFDPETASANMLDTISWFKYQLFLKEGDRGKLKDAKKYCQLIGKRENYSTFKITSLNIHISHIQEIMATK